MYSYLVKNIIAVALCIVAFAIPARANEWDTYTNVLYSFKICYPANLLKPSGESDDGDGNTFTSTSGATLKVWGSYNAAEENIEALTANLVPQINGRAANVSYRRHTDTFSVVSGKNGDVIFYDKIILDKNGYRAFQLMYPVDQSNSYEAVLAKLQSCFQSTSRQ